MKNGVLRNAALMAADIACLTAVWCFCVFGYLLTGFGDYEPERYLRLWPVGLLFVGINLFARTYHGDFFYPSLPLSPVEEFRRLFISAASSHLVLMAILAFVGDNQEFSRVVTFCSGALTALLAQFSRDLMRRCLSGTEWGFVRVMLVGRPDPVARIAAELERDGYSGVRPVCFSGEDGQIVAEAMRRGIRTLVSCQDEPKFVGLVPEYAKWFHHVVYLQGGRMFPTAGGRLIAVGGATGFEMVNQTRMRVKRHEKLVLDCALSVVAFIVLIPFFVLIPILIRLFGGRGPLLYRANRLGRFGKPIRVWKFRTMYADADRRLQDILASDSRLAAEFAENFKLTNDPRVTPLGRILRKTSLDEIPQLFNVFRGEMSLVGPRPIVDAERAYYGANFEIFASVKPGITGLWQCSGRSDTDYSRRVALDVHYVMNWTPWMDLWIVLRTAVAVLTTKGAR